MLNWIKNLATGVALVGGVGTTFFTLVWLSVTYEPIVGPAVLLGMILFLAYFIGKLFRDDF